MGINKLYTDDSPNPYYDYKYPEQAFEDSSYTHYAFNGLGIFAHYFVLECILSAWSEKLSYVSSLRIDVKRLYSLDDMNDFTQLLHTYFEGKRRIAFVKKIKITVPIASPILF